MASKKILNHPIAHDEVANEDRIIFLVVGVVVTVAVFLVMKVMEI
ncbi:MAG: hypothetical protein V1744_07185 [Candidatus Altiarchaeota archaeon]